jgi:hypothetical protein
LRVVAKREDTEPRIARNHNPVFFSFMNYKRVCNKNNTTVPYVELLGRNLFLAVLSDAETVKRRSLFIIECIEACKWEEPLSY